MKPIKRADGTTGYACGAGHVHDSATGAALCDLAPRAPIAARWPGAEYEVVRGLMAVRDEKDKKSLSDEARRWATDELAIFDEAAFQSPNHVRGVLRDMLAVAFEAGRILERREGKAK